MDLTLYCYSYSPTIYADFDTGTKGNEIISWHNDKAYAWKSDKTLFNGWPKDIGFAPVSASISGETVFFESQDGSIHGFDIREWEGSESSYSNISQEAFVPHILSLNGSCLIAQNSYGTVEYGFFHHLKQPQINDLYVDKCTCEGTIDINADIDSKGRYSCSLGIYDKDLNLITILAQIIRTNQSVLTSVWDFGMNATAETYSAILDIETDLGEKITAAISIEPGCLVPMNDQTLEAEASIEASLPIISSINAIPGIIVPGTLNSYSVFHYSIEGTTANFKKNILILNSYGQPVRALIKNTPCINGNFTEIWHGDTSEKIQDKDNNGYADEGEYVFKIELADPNGNTTSESFPIMIAALPALTLLTHSRCFSPNDDGTKDDLVLTYRLEISKLIDDTAIVEMAIYDDKQDLAYKRSDRQHNGDNLLAWDGKSSGTRLPDGSYSLRLTAKDSLGNLSNIINETVVIDTTLPAISIEERSVIFNPYFGPAILKYHLSDNYSSGLLTSISIPVNGTIIKENELLATGIPYADQWNGQNDKKLYLNEGSYYILIIASDEAGNTASSSMEISINDDVRLTSGSSDPKRPYINNWIERSGNYNFIVQANLSINRLACFYLTKRQTIKTVAYAISGAPDRKRFAIYDNFRKKIIFDSNLTGTYYYDLPEGSYTALADSIDGISEARLDIFTVHEDEVSDYYSELLKVDYFTREYSIPIHIDSSAFAGANSSGNDEDYFTVNDDSVSARIRTSANDYISSQHEVIKFGRFCKENSIFQSTSRGNEVYRTINKGFYRSFVRASAWLFAGNAGTTVDFQDKKYDAYEITSNNAGKTWSPALGPTQSDYAHCFGNFLGYFGKNGQEVLKIEESNGQLYYSKGIVINESTHSEPQLINNEYVFPVSVTEPEISWISQAQITYKAKQPKNPSLCEGSDGNVYVVWEDSRDGDREIFFQKIPYNFEPITNECKATFSSIINQPTIIRDLSIARIVNIAENDKFAISNTLNHPNPFDPNKGPTKIRYCLSGGADNVQINIYTLTGSLVKHLSGNIFSNNNDVEWDGRNQYGDIVLNGIYVYEIVARKNGRVARARGKIAVIK